MNSSVGKRKTIVGVSLKADEEDKTMTSLLDLIE